MPPASKEDTDESSEDDSSDSSESDSDEKIAPTAKAINRKPATAPVKKVKSDDSSESDSSSEKDSGSESDSDSSEEETDVEMVDAVAAAARESKPLYLLRPIMDSKL